MNRKIKISFLMALMIIASTFTVVPAVADTPNDVEEVYPFGDVDKYVWDGEEWVDTVEVEIGDMVKFQLNFTYKKTDHPNAYYCRNITIVDTLPNCLEYADSATLEPTDVTGKVITWEYEGELLDNESITIEFQAEVVDYTDIDGEDNIVEITALEKCCSRDLYGSDCATVIVPQGPPIIVWKKVWNGTSWADYLESVTIGQEIEFGINIEYNGYEDINLMKCAIVEDFFPDCCLEYVNDSAIFMYPDETLFEDPDVYVSPDKKYVKFDWTDKLFNLYKGQAVGIKIKAKVVEYCYEEVENCVEVNLWSCEIPCPDCQGVSARDCVTINCCPPPTTFDKYVLDGEEWVKEIETTVGSTLTFKLELKYYGEEPIYEIKFKDVLPCILEYAGNYQSTINVTVQVSEDKKIVWFNATPEVIVSDGTTVTITFDALVTGATGDCDECQATNRAYVYGKVGCTPEPNFYMEDEVKIKAKGNCPPDIPDVTGPESGKVGDTLEYESTLFDANGDKIYYKFDFGTETSGWLGPVNSGTTVSKTISYSSPGTYYVKVKAKDELGLESDWTDYPIEVTITEENEDETEITISVSKINTGKIKATIKNTGDTDLTDVDWQIVLEGGLLKQISVDTQGNIPELDMGESKGLTSQSVMGIGQFLGYVRVETDTYQRELSFVGIIIGPIMIITKTGV